MKAVSTRTTSIIALLLLLLWAASFGLSYVNMGDFSLGVALAIALVKAVLVVLFFMELINEPFTINVTVITGITMMALLTALMMTDLGLRAPPPLSPAVSGR